MPAKTNNVSNMTTRNAALTGWGTYLPERVVTNAEIEATVDTTDDWIVRRTGIRERRIAATGETTSSMAIEAGKRALDQAGLSVADLQLIIVATTTPDELCPPVSSRVQYGLGATNAAALVVQTACTGFVTALITAYQFINSGAFPNALVIGAETLSRFVDWEDRSTCILFGDGAGAVVLEATDGACGLHGFVMGSDGSGADEIKIPAGGSVKPATVMSVASEQHTIRMNGRAVFKFATRILAMAGQNAVAAAGLTFDTVDWVIPHQANKRIIESAARSMGIPEDRFVVNIEWYGNTSAASVAIALAEALDSGQIQPYDKLLLVAFGAGLTWAAAVVQPEPVTSSHWHERFESVVLSER
ncbi:MAG: ketoacyl-ACP synthase III [Anaerolineae bacterium]|nr:ketoacyl-ACP synthase III [Anaerolineae bacterium]